jgi:hypothetical protein
VFNFNFITFLAMNKSLFYQRDQNYCSSFKEYEGLMSQNGVYGNINKSFDAQSRTRSKSDYNQNNNLNSQKHLSQCNTNNNIASGYAYMYNNCVNLNCSNSSCTPHPNEKENFFNRRYEN